MVFSKAVSLRRDAMTGVRAYVCAFVREGARELGSWKPGSRNMRPERGGRGRAERSDDPTRGDMKFGKTTCRSERWVGWAKPLSRGGAQKPENTVFIYALFEQVCPIPFTDSLRPTELVKCCAPAYRRLFQVCRCSLRGARQGYGDP